MDDLLMYLIFVFFGGVLLFCVGLFIRDNYAWKKLPEIRVKGKLVNATYKGHTARTTALPIWDCGEYGCVVSRSDELFRTAKDGMTLYIKKRGSDIRLIGWDNS